MSDPETLSQASRTKRASRSSLEKADSYDEKGTEAIATVEVNDFDESDIVIEKAEDVALTVGTCYVFDTISAYIFPFRSFLYKTTRTCLF